MIRWIQGAARWWHSCWALNPCPDCGRHAPLYGYDYATRRSEPGYTVTAARYRCPKGHYHTARDPFGPGFVVDRFLGSGPTSQQVAEGGAA